MSRNIKEIGKELMGKSLNSFHRKTGLTQLEKNNEMQDGILDGILSQVDDVYIEKIEQSNVIHLDGSGDGVVVLDSIEGNTMVNCFKNFDKYFGDSSSSSSNISSEAGSMLPQGARIKKLDQGERSIEYEYGNSSNYTSTNSLNSIIKSDLVLSSLLGLPLIRCM